MFNSFGNFIKTQKNENANIRAYFLSCIESIDKNNLYMLRRVNMYTAILYSCMLILASFLVPDFKMGLIHLSLVPLLVVMFIINLQTRKPNFYLSTNLTGILCCSFYFLLGLFMVVADVVAMPGRQAIWTPLFIVVFPMIYIDRVYKYGCEELALIAAFSVASYNFKMHDLFARDMYLIIAAYFLSMLSAHVLLEVRAREGLAMLELKKISSLDKLTHVLNKDTLLQRMEHHYMKKDNDSPCSIIIVDVDDFKLVNDNLGHDVGDRLLERVGQLLIDNFRAYDIIGRYGGDEFVVVMPGMDDITILEMRCRTLQMFLTDINLGNGHPFTVSIGAIIDKGGHTANEVFRIADDALYKSKLAGKSRCTTWVLSEHEYSGKPCMVIVTKGDEPTIVELYKSQGANFEIITATTENDALCYISECHEMVKLVVIEMALLDENSMLIKYINSRESFENIPIIAVADSPEISYQAKELGADEVLMTDSSDELYKETIKNLVRM